MDERAREDGNRVGKVYEAGKGALRNDMSAHPPEACSCRVGRVVLANQRTNQQALFNAELSRLHHKT